MAAMRSRKFKKKPRRTYIPQIARLPNKQSPYASKYGDELYVKVQKVEELVTINQAGVANVFSYMRVSQTTSSQFNPTLLD